MNDFRSELEEYNINDLRKLGRELNVQSPTVADKQELVQKIQEVIFSKTKISEYGAKPDFTDVVKVNSEDVSLIERAAIVTQTNQAIIPFGNMCEGHFMPFCDSEGLTLDGVIRENCFVDEVENIFVAQSVICKYDIRPGDYVKGRCIRLKESNFFALFHAEEINGEATRDKIVKGGGKKQQKLKEGHVVLNDMILRDTFSLLKTSYPYQPIELGKDKYLRAIETLTPIYRGARMLISLSPRVDVKNMFVSLNNALNGKDIKVVTLALNIRPENMEFFKQNFVGECHITTCDSEYEESARYAEICMEKAKRDAENGKDTILLIDDIAKLYNGSTFKVGYGKRFGVQRFFDCGRQLEKGGSITVIAMCRNNEISSHLTQSCSSRLDLQYEHGSYDIVFDNTFILDSANVIEVTKKAVISNLMGYAASRGNTLASNLLMNTDSDELTKGFI